MFPSNEKLPVIIVDSREQEPYLFNEQCVVGVRRALPVGDYSLEGHENTVAVERKTLDDFVNSVIHHRDRFFRELRRLKDYVLGCIVVEGNLSDILHHRYRGQGYDADYHYYH